MPFRLRTFGGLSLTGESGPVTGAATQRRKLALLAVLATEGERGVSRDRLLTLFWSESDAEHARHARTQSLSALRRELGSENLVLGSADLRLNPALIDSDVAALETALARGELERAVALYVGPFLDGVHLDHAHASPEFERWVEVERSRLAGLIAEAVERLAIGATERHEHRRAVEWWRRLAALDPYSSQIASGLMRALLAVGDSAGALRQAEIHSTRLRKDLHVEPDGAVFAIVGHIHSGSPPPLEGGPHRHGDPTHGSIAFADAVVPLAQPPGPRHRAARKWQWVLAVGSGLAAAAAALGALFISRSHARAAVDPNLIAVAPFEVFDPKLDLWREGLVDVLSRSLDGAGPLRTVAPSVVVRRWRGRADPASAAELGRRTGAGLAVFGSLIPSGRDSVRLAAALVDVATARLLGEAEGREAVSRIDRLIDSVAVDMLRDLGGTRPLRAVRLGSMGSRSYLALKAFLQAEQYYRRGRWDSALVYCERAVQLDSAFAIAYRRLNKALAWQQPGAPASLLASYLLRAGKANRGLAPRDSLLVSADSIWSSLRLDPSDTTFWPLVRRQFATLDDAARRYPDDPEVWYEVGEARMHNGVHVGVTEQQTLEAFARSVALDSSFAPAYIHLVQLSLDLGDDAAARRYAGRYLALHPDEPIIQLAASLLDPGQAQSAEVARRIDTLPQDVVAITLGILSRWLDPAETQVRLARSLADRPRRTARDASVARWWLSGRLAYRGHLREAYHAVRGLQPGSVADWMELSDLTALGTVPEAEVAVMLAPLAPDRHVRETAQRLPWLAARGDTAALLRSKRLYERAARAARRGSWIERDARGAAAAADAYLALARRDTAEALERFLFLPDTLCTWWCPRYRQERVRLLVARGRLAEAARLLNSGFPGRNQSPILVSDVLWEVERGRVAVRLGDRAQATEGYGYVVRAWAHADPELYSLVDEAQGALRRLGADPLR